MSEIELQKLKTFGLIITNEIAKSKNINKLILPINSNVRKYFNICIGFSTTTLSRRLICHLLNNCSIASHINRHKGKSDNPQQQNGSISYKLQKETVVTRGIEHKKQISKNQQNYIKPQTQQSKYIS